eukprot:TRINITY_DN4018_c0_g1_i2.p2 TRINITY_DN4018_c0_g1~~TRINITY_DN4018_c0_g1_i2.p2  ORF type:complete len:108 (-),score=14.04 TRINITY_DN4018_c0_g1_i2:346-669(-)
MHPAALHHSNLTRFCRRMVENYKFLGKNGYTFELDLFLPQLRLGFEYQGEQHFKDIFQATQVARRQDTDSMKAAACRDAGITLVEIPFDWHEKSNTLIHDIFRQLPS